MKSLNIFYNNNEKSFNVYKALVDKAKYHGFKINTEFSESAFINVCIGGDGSFIRACHQSNFSEIPFIGINAGTLGFFQEIHSHELDRFLVKLKNENYITNRLHLLKVKANTREFYAINDFVVSSRNHSIGKIVVDIDGNHLENFAGDGLIVSTPAGSTAYNFSVGGSILYQELKGYQLSPIAPINTKAHRSLLNSIVLSNKETLSMSASENCQLIVDGYRIEDEIDNLEFTMPEKYINKLVFNTDYYWKNLKDKFL